MGGYVLKPGARCRVVLCSYLEVTGGSVVDDSAQRSGYMAMSICRDCGRGVGKDPKLFDGLVVWYNQKSAYGEVGTAAAPNVGPCQ